MLNRDRYFWAVAMQVAVVNFYLGGFGPAQPLLRSQQRTSLTVAGLHGTALGIASIVIGLFGPKLVHRVGRAAASWIGLGLFCVGILMFVLLPPIQLTLTATFITGLGTSLVVNSMVTQLSHHFGVHAPNAVSQASGISSAGYVMGTLIVGAIAGTRFNWRLGLLVAIPFTVILYLTSRSVIAIVHIPEESGAQHGRLSRKFWLSWIGFVACISSEFATTFWAAALLRNRVGGSAAISTICIVAVGSGMGFGRWFGPRLLRSSILDKQLSIVIITQMIGFGVFWFSHVLALSLISLFAVGTGISMQFALASLRLIGFSEGRPDLAIGRSSLGAGIAIAGAPFLLGLLGDHLGISRAYLMVPVLILIALATIIAIPSVAQSRQERA